MWGARSFYSLGTTSIGFSVEKGYRKVFSTTVFSKMVLSWTILPDTRLPRSRAGGQGPYLRSVEHLGRSGIAKNPINAKKVKCDGRTDGPTDGRTDGPTDGWTDKAGCRVTCTQLKIRRATWSLLVHHEYIVLYFISRMR